MSKSKLEALFALQMRALKIPEPVTEFAFHRTRRWRFDFAWPDLRIAVEIDGGIHTNGRHVRPRGFSNDCHKMNCAALMGWLVIRLTGEMVRNGIGLMYLQEAMELVHVGRTCTHDDTRHGLKCR